MLEKSMSIKGMITAIIFVTLGFTQVSLEIKNVDTDDDGCTDPQYTTQSACEAGNCCTTANPISCKWYTVTLRSEEHTS